MATAAEYQAAYLRIFQNNTLSDAQAQALAAMDSGAGYNTPAFQSWASQFTTNAEVVYSTGGVVGIWSTITGRVPSTSDLLSQTNTLESLTTQYGSSSIAFKALGASLANSSFAGTFATTYNQDTNTILGQQSFVQAAFLKAFGREATAGEIAANVTVFQTVKAAYAKQPVTETTTDARAKGEFLADLIKQAIDFSIGPNTDLPVFDQIEATITALASNTYVPAAPIENQPGAPQVGVNLRLSPNLDNVNGSTGGDTVDGTLLFNSGSGTFIQTFTTGDRVAAGTGVDTALIQTNTTSTVTPATFSGVEVLDIQAITGTPTFNLINGDNALTTINAHDNATTITVNNVNSAVSTINLTNNTAGAFALTTANAALAGATDAVTVNLNSVTTAGGVSLLLNAAGTNGYETVTVNSTGAVANNIGALSVMGINTLNLTGSQAVTLSSPATTLTTVAGGTATGNINLTLTGVANTAVTLGSGNDVLNMSAAGVYTTADVINGGTGTDRLDLSNAQLTAAVAVQTNVSGFENLGATTGTTGTITVSNFGATGLQYQATQAGATVINYAAGTNLLDLQGNGNGGFTTTVNVAGVATNDVLNVTTTGSAMTGAVTTNGAEIVNLAATGATTFGTTFTMTNTAATETLNITGNSAVTFTGAVTAEVINAGAMTAGGSLTLTGGVVAAGGATITGTLGADLLIGSAANDIINAGAGADRINGGAGADIMGTGAGNDVIVLVSQAQTRSGTFAGTDTTAANIDAVTDFVGNGNAAGDSFEVSGTANVFGAALDFSAATTAVVTAVTVATAADFAAMLTGLGAGAASTDAVAQIYDVTVTAGNLAGRYLVINDETATFAAANDTIINITGITGALNAQDFTFVA